ncbi:MAG: hypothetical protein RLY86_1375 [Pseudomonadota bacterium]
MRSTFLERRRQLREPVTDGRVTIAGRPHPLVNWSQNGLLIDAWTQAVPPGHRFAAEVSLKAVGGERFRFPAEARAVRHDPRNSRLAATFVCLDMTVAPRILQHFNPVQTRRVEIVTERAERAAREDIAAAAATTAGKTAELPPFPPPDAGEDGPDDHVRLADMVVAAREVARLKTAFARRFHPDTAPRDESHPLRVEMFKEFWDVLDATERRLKGGGALAPRRSD